MIALAITLAAAFIVAASRRAKILNARQEVIDEQWADEFLAALRADA